MKKLFLLKKGNMIFYACLWDFGRYSIEKITKAVGFTVKFFDTLENLENTPAKTDIKKQYSNLGALRPVRFRAVVFALL